MHRALRVDEISQRCFAPLSKSDNYHLALTTSTFLEPALNELWRDLRDLYALVALLPGDLYRVDREYVDVPYDEEWEEPAHRALASAIYVSAVYGQVCAEDVSSLVAVVI